MLAANVSIRLHFIMLSNQQEPSSMKPYVCLLPIRFYHRFSFSIVVRMDKCKCESRCRTKHFHFYPQTFGEANSISAHLKTLKNE